MLDGNKQTAAIGFFGHKNDHDFSAMDVHKVDGNSTPLGKCQYVWRWSVPEGQFGLQRRNIVLVLLQVPLTETPHAQRDRLEDSLTMWGGILVEFLPARDLDEVYYVIETVKLQVIENALAELQIKLKSMEKVNLVGRKAWHTEEEPTYLIEITGQHDLTIEENIKGKCGNKVGASNICGGACVRAYVTGDMSKCVCLYMADAQESVAKVLDGLQASMARFSRVIE